MRKTEIELYKQATPFENPFFLHEILKRREMVSIFTFIFNFTFVLNFQITDGKQEMSNTI